ncbi:MAG TPA: SNF2-related protein, partial [Pseudonocardiaceae bacterium]|nr:SNF2-related protein [Pseudonocardiaceae bacterium]
MSGGLSWSAVGSLHHYGEYRTSHVRLLQELYALYRSGTHHYSYGEDKTIDLAVFGSRQLWPILDEAAALGVQLVYGRKGLGAVEKYGQAELCLDVTGREQPDSLIVTPVLRVDGTGGDAIPVRFIGAEGHGVVYLPGAEARDGADPGDGRFRLARLASPVPPALQRMALECRRLEIPAAEQDRFRDEFYPRLRHLAPVISSDESFTPPAISDPTLVLHASYGTGHDLGISWEWAYQVGDLQVRAPMRVAEGNAEEGYRDLAKEREVLDELDVALDRFGLRSGDPEQGLLSRAALGGLDTMRFTTEALPLLADAPGVAVEVDGEPADYREASDSLRIGLSTDDVAGEPDWFDLGVSIAVEGREVPFADVFVALASEQTHLLLPDGAYFSLQKPELQALRRLIEEARALQDAPEGRLRISRFQAGLWDELTELGVVDRQAKAWQQQVSGLLSLDSVPATELPGSVSATLRPYQRTGFGWLAFLWQFRLGGILADDMGLGKTLQSLALICHAKQADPAISPFLIVAPTSVVSNWPAEAARFAPGLTAVPVCDTLRRWGQDLDEIIAGADVVVTSYTLFRLDFEAYAATEWSGLILDEAQHTKNHQSKIYQCARKLAAPFKLAITGTPMENNLME